MTAAGEVIREEIDEAGPISFRRFMELALYHPRHGYYMRRLHADADPFGMHGDFYTAQQLQPVFGILIRESLRQLRQQMGSPESFTVVELGAGRGEMSPWFSEWRHTGIDMEGGELPQSFQGVVFANEFFDALPVYAVVRRGNVFHELLVGKDGENFRWVEGSPPPEPVTEHLARYGAPAEDGQRIEVCVEALRVLDRLDAAMERGFLLAIDYGYTRREMVRFPEGTLMGYRRHQAIENVLEEPGERDITAHVNFTALEEHAARLGWHKVRFESMAQLLLRAGEQDQFASVLACPETGQTRRRLQLKTLLYGMGETFRALLVEKGSGQ